jgi:hypothetical protein
MRQQSFIILLLGASVCLACGQNNPKKYYEYINKAELAYLQMSDDNDLGQKAAQYYEKAFAANRPFSKDLRYYLFLYSNNKQGRLDVALECAHILAQRGMLWPKWYDADTAFQRTLYLIKDTTRVITDPELVAALDSLRTRDRNFRNGVRRWDDESFQAVAALDSANMQSLVELFQQYGHINEDNAGELYASTIELLFIHNSKTRTAELPFDVVEKAVKEGTYDARSYMDFYDECLTWRCSGDTICETRYGLGFSSHIVIGNTLFIYPTGDVTEIDVHRETLGVSETYADYEKKLENAFLSNGAGFVPRLNIEDWGSEEEDAQTAAEARADIDSGKVKGRYVIKQ